MAAKTVKVKNKTGIHARPASMLVDAAQDFESKISLVYDGQEVNAKSVMGVMSLAVTHDTRVTLKAEGPDAQEALATLEKIIDNKFGEE